MDTYLIYLSNENADAWEKVKETWSHHHILDDRVAFVAPEKVTTTAAISDSVGLGEGDEGNELTGIVVSMGAYNGYNDRSLWEWLDKVAKL